MSRKAGQPGLSSERVFDFVRKFNHAMVADEEFARQLPAHEFELKFDKAGNIYIDGKPLGINVNQRHRALLLRSSRRSSS